MILRFASSGNGDMMSKLRRPASACTTGICRLNAAIAAAVEVVVSPWTTIASGFSSWRMRSTPSRILAKIEFRVWRGWMMFRSWAGTMPNSSLTWSSISRCWPVTATTQSNWSDASSAFTIGATLMASGRVP